MNVNSLISKVRKALKFSEAASLVKCNPAQVIYQEINPGSETFELKEIRFDYYQHLVIYATHAIYYPSDGKGRLLWTYDSFEELAKMLD